MPSREIPTAIGSPAHGVPSSSNSGANCPRELTVALRSTAPVQTSDEDTASSISEGGFPPAHASSRVSRWAESDAASLHDRVMLPYPSSVRSANHSAPAPAEPVTQSAPPATQPSPSVTQPLSLPLSACPLSAAGCAEPVPATGSAPEAEGGPAAEPASLVHSWASALPAATSAACLSSWAMFNSTGRCRLTQSVRKESASLPRQGTTDIIPATCSSSSSSSPAVDSRLRASRRTCPGSIPRREFMRLLLLRQ